MVDTMQHNESRESAGLLDAEGRLINHGGRGSSAARGSGDLSLQIEEYIRAQPVKSAFIMMGIGYIIGRLRLIV